MHICNRCEARHKDALSTCSVCGFKKITEWKAAANRGGSVTVSAPALPKDIVRIKIGWKNTVKSIVNNEQAPRAGRWIAFYIPTSCLPLEKDVEGNGFRVTLTIHLQTKGSLRYYGKSVNEEFVNVTEQSFRLSEPKHGWHYAQVTGSGTEANHVIALKLEERAYSRFEESINSTPLIPWTFWYFPHSTARLPVAYLTNIDQEKLIELKLGPVKEKYAQQIAVLEERTKEEEKQVRKDLRESTLEQYQKTLREDETLTDEYYETRAEKAKQSKKETLLKSFEEQRGKTENVEALKLKMNQDYNSYAQDIEKKLQEFKEEAERKRARLRENLRSRSEEELLRVQTKLERELRIRIEELRREETKKLEEIKSSLIANELMAPLVTFEKYFSTIGQLQDGGKAIAWEANPKNGHCGDITGWSGHCDAAGFASAMFEEPVDNGIWKGEELKFIVTEYFMSFVLAEGNSYITWQLGGTENRNDPSHLNFVGHFRKDLESEGTYAKQRANEQKLAAGKNGANLLDKLQAAFFHGGIPLVMDMRVDGDVSEENLVQSAKAVWNHCVFCYVVVYRESAEAEGGLKEKACDLVAHLTLYANSDHSPPTSSKSAKINLTNPPDITLIPENCIIRRCAIRVQFDAKGKIDPASDKADWFGCHAKRRQKDDLDFEYGFPRLPPRYLTIMVSTKPTKAPMHNPFITQDHIVALVKAGVLKWTRNLD